MIDYKNKYTKYKIKYLNLVGGVKSQEIDLLSCSKFSLFKQNKLIEGEYFTAESFSQKRKAFTELDIIKCSKINEMSLDPGIKAICILLLKLVDQLNDFVEFIRIFGNTPYNESKLVKEIIEMFDSFNFKFNSNDLLSFLVKFLLFLQELINKIKFLFEQILKNADYDSIFELNFGKFNYFCINFEDYYVFHKKTFVYCPIFFNVFKERYLNIFKLIDELKTVFNSNIETLLKIIKDINTLYQSSHGNLQSIFAAYETRLRVSIIPICKELLEIVKFADCTDFLNNLKLFSYSNFNEKINNEIILKLFYKLIDGFKTDTKCTKDNKVKIYGLLNRIAVILKFLSTPEKQKEIKIKILEALKSLSFIDKVVVNVKDKSNYIIELKAQIDKFKDSLKCVKPTDPIQNKFNDFKESLNLSEINRIDIGNLNVIDEEVKKFKTSKCLFNRGEITQKDLKSIVDNIRKILESNIVT